MKGEWILKEVYFVDGWPSIIRDPIREAPSDESGKTVETDWQNKETSVFVNFQLNEVSPLEFVNMVIGKEDLVGMPVVWSQWPRRDRKNDSKG
jgi:hypothetical protein